MNGNSWKAAAVNPNSTASPTLAGRTISLLERRWHLSFLLLASQSLILTCMEMMIIQHFPMPRHCRCSFAVLSPDPEGSLLWSTGTMSLSSRVASRLAFYCSRHVSTVVNPDLKQLFRLLVFFMFNLLQSRRFALLQDSVLHPNSTPPLVDTCPAVSKFSILLNVCC